MKTTKRVLAIMLTALMTLGVFALSAGAAPSSSATQARNDHLLDFLSYKNWDGLFIHMTFAPGDFKTDIDDFYDAYLNIGPAYPEGYKMDVPEAQQLQRLINNVFLSELTESGLQKLYASCQARVEGANQLPVMHYGGAGELMGWVREYLEIRSYAQEVRDRFKARYEEKYGNTYGSFTTAVDANAGSILPYPPDHWDSTWDALTIALRKQMTWSLVQWNGSLKSIAGAIGCFIDLPEDAPTDDPTEPVYTWPDAAGIIADFTFHTGLVNKPFSVTPLQSPNSQLQDAGSQLIPGQSWEINFGYDSNNNANQPTPGTSVTLKIPLPTGYNESDVMLAHNGANQVSPTGTEQINGTKYLLFTVTGFSEYSLVTAKSSPAPKWWESPPLPLWLHLALRWLCFGWIWMK